MVDFILVVIELFYCLLRLRRYKRKYVEVGVFEGVGQSEHKFQREGASPTNHCWWQKTRVITISCSIKISTVCYLVLSQYTHLRDRRTDRQNCDSYTVRCITFSRTVKTDEQSRP